MISQENSSLASMGTDQLLDLFSLDSSSKGVGLSSRGSQSEDASHLRSMAGILENMGELWDTKQYEDEYDLGNFMQSLNK